jgi:hypothetical protein
LHPALLLCPVAPTIVAGALALGVRWRLRLQARLLHPPSALLHAQQEHHAPLLLHAQHLY